MLAIHSVKLPVFNSVSSEPLQELTPITFLVAKLCALPYLLPLLKCLVCNGTADLKVVTTLR